MRATATTRQNRPVQTDDEAVLDPWVADWFAANPMFGTPLPDLSPEVLDLARSPIGAPPTREIGKITDDVVAGVPVRIYEHDAAPTGVVVYFHGGGFCIGSIGLMDNVARELAHCSGATVVSAEYRLAPEHPYPAGLDDCEAVTRWAFANAARLGADPTRIAVAGESAGGNLSAAVALRLRDAPDAQLAAQVLIYPVVDGKDAPYPSRAEFDGIVISAKNRKMYHDAYAGPHDIDHDPFALPIRAASLTGLPPAIVVTGGCDPLRDEGRAYAQRLRNDDVVVEELCCAGQPHGFVNFGFPAATEAFARVGAFLRSAFT